MYNKAGSQYEAKCTHTYVRTHVLEEDSMRMCMEYHIHTLYIRTYAPVPLITAHNAAGPYGG